MNFTGAAAGGPDEQLDYHLLMSAQAGFSLPTEHKLSATALPGRIQLCSPVEIG